MPPKIEDFVLKHSEKYARTKFKEINFNKDDWAKYPKQWSDIKTYNQLLKELQKDCMIVWGRLMAKKHMRPYIGISEAQTTKQWDKIKPNLSKYLKAMSMYSDHDAKYVLDQSDPKTKSTQQTWKEYKEIATFAQLINNLKIQGYDIWAALVKKKYMKQFKDEEKVLQHYLKDMKELIM